MLNTQRTPKKTFITQKAGIFELYDRHRSYEEHENALINHRTSWLVAMQTALFAALVFSIEHNSALHSKFYILLICFLGSLVSVWAFQGITSALEAQKAVRNNWNTRHAPSARKVGLPEIAGGGSEWAAKVGGRFASALPIISLLAWLAIFFIGPN